MLQPKLQRSDTRMSECSKPWLLSRTRITSIRTNFFHRLQLEAVAHLQHNRDDDTSLKGLSEHDKQRDDAENVRHTAVL